MSDLGATPEQLRVLDFVSRTNFGADAQLEAAAVVRVPDWPDHKVVLVWPDGSYHVAYLGDAHTLRKEAL